MFFKRIRLLPPGEFMKAALPLAAIFCVIFLKTMVESNIQDYMDAKLRAVHEEHVLKIPDEDRTFIQALLSSENINNIQPFFSQDFYNSPYIVRYFNAVKPEERSQTPQTTEIFTGDTPVAVSVPVYSVSAVFRGKSREYAIINSTVVVPGDVMPDGSKIKAISDGKVLIEGFWGKQWFYVTY